MEPVVPGAMLNAVISFLAFYTTEGILYRNFFTVEQRERCISASAVVYKTLEPLVGIIGDAIQSFLKQEKTTDGFIFPPKQFWGQF